MDVGANDMMLGKYFSKREMERSATATRLGLSNSLPEDLVPNATLVAEHLDIAREHFGRPVRVLSCYRSPAVNAAVGGSRTSAHRFAMAADVEIDGVSVLELCKWCAENISDFDQIIYEFGEDGWMHIGFRHHAPRKQLLTAKKVNSKTVYTEGLHA